MPLSQGPSAGSSCPAPSVADVAAHARLPRYKIAVSPADATPRASRPSAARPLCPGFPGVGLPRQCAAPRRQQRRIAKHEGASASPPPHLPRQLPTLPLELSRASQTLAANPRGPVSDRRSRDAAAGYGGNDHIVRAHTAAGTEQRGAPPPAQCMFTRRTIEEARRGGASLSEQRGHGGAANQRRHG
jgi:hypothetical protein